jgi:hypothetical protein
MESVQGIWHCPNFLGDSFELTACDDGALMLQMVRKRLRSRGSPIRLEPCSRGCWEAAQQVRLQVSSWGELFLQHHQHEKWGPEKQVSRDSVAATGSFFRDVLKLDILRQAIRKDSVGAELLIKRQTSNLFKVDPVAVGSRFVRRDDRADPDLKNTQCVWNSSSECKICMANETDVVLIPCGHSGLCEECVRKMMSDDNKVSCPFCRLPVQKISHIDNTSSQIILTAEDLKPISILVEKGKLRRLAWP